MRNQRRQRFLSHLQEDTLEETFTRLKTKLDVLQQVIDIFKDDSDPTVKREIQTTKQEILRDIKSLASRGINMIDVYAKFGGILYKADIIKGQEILSDLRKKQKDSQVVDFINEDMQLYKRNEINQQQFDQRYIDKYNQRIRPQLYINNPRVVLPADPPLFEAMSEVVRQRDFSPRSQQDSEVDIIFRALTGQLMGQRNSRMSSPPPSYSQQQRVMEQRAQQMQNVITQEQVQQQQQQQLQQRLQQRQQQRQPSIQMQSPASQIQQQSRSGLLNIQEESKDKLRADQIMKTPSQKSQVSQQQLQSPQALTQQFQFNLSPAQSIQSSPKFQQSPDKQQTQQDQNLFEQIDSIAMSIQDANDLNADSLQKYEDMINIIQQLTQFGSLEQTQVLEYFQGVINNITKVDGVQLDESQISILKNTLFKRMNDEINNNNNPQQRLIFLGQLLQGLYIQLKDYVPQQIQQQPVQQQFDYDQFNNDLNKALVDIAGNESLQGFKDQSQVLKNIHYTYHNGQLVLGGIQDVIPQEAINYLVNVLQGIDNEVQQQDVPQNAKQLLQQANAKFLNEFNQQQQQQQQVVNFKEDEVDEEMKQEVKRGRGISKGRSGRAKSQTNPQGQSRSPTPTRGFNKTKDDQIVEFLDQNDYNGATNLIVEGLNNFILYKDPKTNQQFLQNPTFYFDPSTNKVKKYIIRLAIAQGRKGIVDFIEQTNLPRTAKSGREVLKLFI